MPIRNQPMLFPRDRAPEETEDDKFKKDVARAGELWARGQQRARYKRLKTHVLYHETDMEAQTRLSKLWSAMGTNDRNWVIMPQVNRRCLSIVRNLKKDSKHDPVARWWLQEIKHNRVLRPDKLIKKTKNGWKFVNNSRAFV